MSRGTDKAASPIVDPSQAAGGAPARHVAVWWLWGAVLVSLACVTGAMTLRSRADQPIVVQWGAAIQVAQPLGLEEGIQNEGPSADGSLLEAPTDGLDGLGAQLDDPAFAALKRSRRFDPNDVVPVSRRWQFAFSTGLTEGQYAEQLAALDVELGVLVADGSMQYVAGIGQAGEKKRRAGRRPGESRPYWTWDRGDLADADQVLLEHAGLAVSDEVVLHFFAPATIAKLTELEKEFQDRKPGAIALTRFAFKRTFRGYEIYVAEQIER